MRLVLAWDLDLDRVAFAWKKAVATVWTVRVLYARDPCSTEEMNSTLPLCPAKSALKNNRRPRSAAKGAQRLLLFMKWSEEMG